MELLIKKLHEIQKEHNYISEEKIIELSKEYNMPKAEVYGVISFYSRFYLKPVGKYIVRVCQSISCEITKSKEVFASISNYLNVSNGETTQNKRFTLEHVECLGQCGKGPVMTINDEVFGNLTKDKALEIIKKYEKENI